MPGRFANAMSCVLSTCLATVGDEMIIADTSPSCSFIIGPCFLAKSVVERCSCDEKASWCKFPINGSSHGPGGNFWFWPLALDFFQRLSRIKRKKKQVNRGKERPWIILLYSQVQDLKSFGAALGWKSLCSR
jgi:hypothetical protein